jgi:hypothetical protein
MPFDRLPLISAATSMERAVPSDSAAPHAATAAVGPRCGEPPPSRRDGRFHEGRPCGLPVPTPKTLTVPCGFRLPWK